MSNRYSNNNSNDSSNIWSIGWMLSNIEVKICNFIMGKLKWKNC